MKTIFIILALSFLVSCAPTLRLQDNNLIYEGEEKPFTLHIDPQFPYTSRAKFNKLSAFEFSKDSLDSIIILSGYRNKDDLLDEFVLISNWHSPQTKTNESFTLYAPKACRLIRINKYFFKGQVVIVVARGKSLIDSDFLCKSWFGPAQYTDKQKDFLRSFEEETDRIISTSRSAAVTIK